MQNLFKYLLGLMLIIGSGGCGGGHSSKGDGFDSNQSDIAAAKQLFKSLRTEARGLVKLDSNDSNGFLDMEADKLGKSLEDAMLNIDLVGQYSGAVLQKVLEQTGESAPVDTTVTVFDVEEGRDVELHRVSPLVWNYTIKQGAMSLGTGTLTLPDDNLDTLSLDGDVDLNTSLIGTFPLNSVESGKIPGTQHGTLKISLTKKSDVALFDIEQLSVSSANALVELSDFTISAKYDNDNTIQHMFLDGTNMRVEVPGYLYEGTLSFPEEKYVENTTMDKNNGMIPSRLVFNGSLTNRNNNAKITGVMQVDLLNASTIDMDQNVDKSMHLKTEIHGLLKRPQYKDTNITLGIDEPVGSTDKTVTFSYRYDNTVVNATGSFDHDMRNGTVEISTSDEIKVFLQIKDGDLVYEGSSYVENGGVQIGTIEERNGVTVVHYNDGTFESLQ